MKVSILIPNYNHGHLLSRALNSICSQNPDEVVVVDDCSTDNSLEIIDAFQEEYSFVKSIRNTTKSDDWTKALIPIIKSLDTDYIVGMGADDVLYPSFYENIKHSINDYPNAGFIFTDYNYIDDRSNVLGVSSCGYKEITYLYGESILNRQSTCQKHECGVGCALKKEIFVWLNSIDHWKMGPWQDSIGFGVGSILYGAVYIPKILAGFTVRQSEPSYHQRYLYNNVLKQQISQEVDNFFTKDKVNTIDLSILHRIKRRWEI
jgi:glycosyltransferase involved in cell wall biosynthesis